MRIEGIDRWELERITLRSSGPTRPDAIGATKQDERSDGGWPSRGSSAGQTTFLHLSYDKNIGRVVVRILDESGKMVRQLPSEETVAFLRQFREAVPLVNETV